MVRKCNTDLPRRMICNYDMHRILESVQSKDDKENVTDESNEKLINKNISISKWARSPLEYQFVRTRNPVQGGDVMMTRVPGQMNPVNFRSAGAGSILGSSIFLDIIAVAVGFPHLPLDPYHANPTAWILLARLGIWDRN